MTDDAAPHRRPEPAAGDGPPPADAAGPPTGGGDEQAGWQGPGPGGSGAGPTFQTPGWGYGDQRQSPPPGAAFTSRYGLVRPRQGRYLAGVCAAVGRATNTDPILWRVLLAVLGFFGGIGILVYVAAWLIIPAEGDTASPVESMLGRGKSSMSPVTVLVLGVLVAVMFGYIVTDAFRAVLLGVAILIGGALLLNREANRSPAGPPGPTGGSWPAGFPTESGPVPPSPYSPPSPHGPPSSYGPSPGAVPPPHDTAPSGDYPRYPVAEARGGPADDPTLSYGTVPAGSAGPWAAAGPPAHQGGADQPAAGQPPADSTPTSASGPQDRPLSPVGAAPAWPPAPTSGPAAGGTPSWAAGYPPAPVGGYRQPFAPRGPYAGPYPPGGSQSGGYPPASFPPGGPVPSPGKPPKRPKPPRERSRLGGATFSLIFVAIGVVAMLDLINAVPVGPSTYFAGVLLTIAGGLLVGTWFGRARWLIALGLVAAAALGISTLAESYDEVRHDGGTVNWTPVDRATMANRYETRFGDAVLDLRQIDFTGDDSQITVQVDFGKLEVILPPEVDAMVELTIRAGDADVFGTRWSGFDEPSREFTDLGSDGAGGGELRLHVYVNAGDAEVTR
nr:PspC domain-containing protein [Micromonospora sp. DSM 115978]